MSVNKQIRSACTALSTCTKCLPIFKDASLAAFYFVLFWFVILTRLIKMYDHPQKSTSWRLYSHWSRASTLCRVDLFFRTDFLVKKKTYVTSTFNCI